MSQSSSAKTNPALWRWLGLAFFFFLILVAFWADSGQIPGWLRAIYGFSGGDKVGHFVLYGIFAFLAVLAWPRPLRLGRFSLPWGLFLAVGFAILEEISQFWFARRTPDWADLGFGFLGIAAGMLLARLVKKWAK